MNWVNDKYFGAVLNENCWMANRFGRLVIEQFQPKAFK